jgi:hypothetical protein
MAPACMSSRQCQLFLLTCPARLFFSRSGGECGIAYERRIQMPTPADDKPWYSFDFGPIHFLQYSTEHDFSRGSEQHRYPVRLGK